MRSPTKQRAAIRSLVVSVLLLAGCQRSPAPPPSPSLAPPAPTAAPAGSPARVETAADRSTRYSQEHPWGEYTGMARLRGTVSWAEGSEPPAPLYRRALFLRGLPGTRSEGRYYRVRADAKGEYVFDRILGGEYELSDNLTAGFHWRLRVRISERDDLTLDLTRANSIEIRDDFADRDRQG